MLTFMFISKVNIAEAKWILICKSFS